MFNKEIWGSKGHQIKPSKTKMLYKTNMTNTLLRIIQIPMVLTLFLTHSECVGNGQKLQHPSITNERKNKLF